MSRPVEYVCVICMVVFIPLQSVFAQAPPSTQSSPRVTAEMVKEISDQLQGDDPAGIEQSIDQIHGLLQDNGQKTGNMLRLAWIKRLLELRRYDDVLDLTQLGILATPADTSLVEQLQGERVQALLLAGRGAEALIAARQLFNVSTLKGTSQAIRTICQCLNAVYPDDRNVLKQYREEEITGADPGGSPAAGPSCLAGIRIDPSPYRAAISRITAEEYRALTGKGNLLLLAGSPKDAWDVFTRAYTLASDRDLAAASENLARCMKAEDGTIGRANSWVLSLRPKAEAASLRSIGADVAPMQAGNKE